MPTVQRTGAYGARAPIIAGVTAIGAAALLLIKAGEGTGPVQTRADGIWYCAYADPATRGDPWTIGFGHTGPEVKKGLCVPEKRAQELLLEDIGKAQAALARCVKVPVHENELGALSSLTMNIGGRNACGSTLVRKLNAGDYMGAAAEFPRWRYAAGKVMPGLVKRRECERRLFSTPPTEANHAATIAMIKVCILKGQP